VRAQEAASDEDDEDDEHEGSDDDELQILMGDGGMDDDDEEETQFEDEEPAGPSTSVPTNNGKAPLKLSSFKWDGEVEDGMNVGAAAESASDDDEDEEEAASSKKAKPASSGILINDQTGSLSSQLPTSPSDFDRLVLANPNSSELWISYMSYYLGLSDLESARQIAQRALKTINYREEEEKLNIWVALINLENQSSDEDALDTTINKALQHNDPKKVYQRTVELLEATEKYEKATEVYERFIKKFNMASKAWTLYGGFLLRRGRSDAARELLPRSLKSLPKRKRRCKSRILHGGSG
jgi:rRNA biogenesis protein RRP5